MAVSHDDPPVTPDDPPADEQNFTPHVREDGVLYDDLSPWPVSADGSGLSLQRQALIFAGDVATSWSAAAPTPGVVAAPGGVTGDFTGDGIVDAVDIDVLADAVSSGIVAFLDLDGSGTADQADVTFLVTNVFGTLPGDANLDGVVDGSDFNRWNDGKFQSCAKSWAHGDFNGDTAVDGADFNIWLTNSFRPVQAPKAENDGTARSERRVPKQPLANVAVPRARAIDAVHGASAKRRNGVQWQRSSKLEMPASNQVEGRGIVGDRIGTDRGRIPVSDVCAHRGSASHCDQTADPAADVARQILDSLLAGWGI